MQEPIHGRRAQYEPGRRYNAGRASMPRAGADIRPPVRSARPVRPLDPKPKPEPILPPKRTVSHAKPALPRTKRSMVLKRQMVERAEAQRVKVKKNHKKHFFIYGFTVLLLILLGVVIWSFRELLPFDITWFDSKPKVTNVVTSPTSDTPTLDETRVTKLELEQNQVMPNAPKILAIPKLSIESRVWQVGTTLTNEPIAPKNIYDVGWFESGGKPNENGAVLLIGHSVGPTKPGVFKRVKELSAGDKILLTLGNGQSIQYSVVQLQEYPTGAIDMRAATSSIDPEKRGLNLVTTITKYSGSEKRLIVFAVQD